jgi:invasion protein IalB
MLFTTVLVLLPQNYTMAQTADTPAPLEDFSIVEIVGTELNLGDYYDKGQFNDWTLRCVKTKNPVDPCQLFQLMFTGTGTPVAEFNLSVIEPNGVVIAGANVITPLETLLTAQLKIQVDDTNAKAYPFAFCMQMGCVARVGLTEEDLAGYRTGNAATVTIVPAGAPNQQEVLTLSLIGFTAGYNALIAN